MARHSDSDKVVRGFKAVHVWDIEQTDGDALPEFEGVSGEPGDWLHKLEQVIRKAGIELEYVDDLGGAKGLSQGGKISMLTDRPAAQTFSTLVHEYAHELLHKGERRKETSKKRRCSMSGNDEHTRVHRKSKRRAVHPLVRQIISRDCHVSLSNREVIRRVISRLKEGHATFRAMPREDRRELLRQCIEVHRENWELYVDVMSGDVSGRLRRRRSKRKEGA